MTAGLKAECMQEKLYNAMLYVTQIADLKATFVMLH
jgi:hypothetical protein